MLAGASEGGLCLLQFADQELLPTQLSMMQQRLGMPSGEGDHIVLDQLTHQLKAYFHGERKDFDLPLQLDGTPLQEQVWRTLLATVPFGKTSSYGQLATAIGSPRAVRPVAAANAANACLIVVPCHRIVGASGQLTGYRGGLLRKQSLLALEGQGLLF